jgi:hypothetical protein
MPKARTIWDLKEELAAKQSRALTAIFDSHAQSARVELDLDEREAQILSEAQMGRLWARQRQDWLKEVRDESKAAYLAAELEYAEAQRERVKEIHERVFGATREAGTDQVQKLAEASPETLDTMLTLALESGNETVARQVLHIAHVRDDGERILIRWGQEVEGGDEDLERLGELDEALDEEQLRARLDEELFERVAPDELTWENLTPQPGTPVLLKK